MSIKVIAIAAMDEGRVIGFANKLPWHIPEDARRFASLTKGHTVLMGRKTYQSLPEKYRPLPQRKNVVVTRNRAGFEAPPSVDTVSSPSEYLAKCKSGECTLPSDKVWIVGGEQIYKETLQLWDELYLTKVHSTNRGDAFFPEFESNFELCEVEDKEGYSFLRYRRV